MATTVSSAPTAAAPSVTPERIMQMAWGYAPPLILESAIRHRVFDVLDSGPKTVEQVSQETGASVRGLTSIMNALVGFEFLTKDGDEYGLAPESAAFLVSTKPGFQGGLLKHVSSQLIPGWLHLNEVVASGAPANSVNQEGQGADFFEKFVNDIFPLSAMPARELGEYLRLDLMDGRVS